MLDGSFDSSSTDHCCVSWWKYSSLSGLRLLGQQSIKLREQEAKILLVGNGE